jgi:nucleoside-diphosphate-sugar epimerase
MIAGTTLLAGYGYTARALARRLDAAGTAWQAHSRSGDGGHRVLDLDIDTPEAVAPLQVDGVSIVYSIAPSPQGSADARMPRWLALLQGHPSRMLYLSTTGVYGHQPEGAVDETTPPQPVHARAIRRLTAERALSEWCARRGVPLLIFRLPAIYGPDRLPLQRLRRGDPVLDPAHSPPSYRIHVEDLAAALLCGLSPALPAGIYLLRDESEWSLSCWFTQVAELAGLPAPPRVDLAEARERLSPAMLEFMTDYRRLDARASRARLGMTLRYPDPREGVRASLVQMGWLPDQPGAPAGSPETQAERRPGMTTRDDDQG